MEANKSFDKWLSLGRRILGSISYSYDPRASIIPVPPCLLSIFTCTTLSALHYTNISLPPFNYTSTSLSPFNIL
jgi:hypothetical protein